MVTAEYAVGVLAAASIAATLLRLGADGGWFTDELWNLVRAALRPGVLLEQVHRIPWLAGRL